MNKLYMNIDKQKLLEYIRDNFEIDMVAYNLIDSIYDYLNNNCCSYISYDHTVYIPAFLDDLLDILNDSRIDR